MNCDPHRVRVREAAVVAGEEVAPLVRLLALHAGRERDGERLLDATLVEGALVPDLRERSAERLPVELDRGARHEPPVGRIAETAEVQDAIGAEPVRPVPLRGHLQPVLGPLQLGVPAHLHRVRGEHVHRTHLPARVEGLQPVGAVPGREAALRLREQRHPRLPLVRDAAEEPRLPRVRDAAAVDALAPPDAQLQRADRERRERDRGTGSR
jgi:hypothetical protein